jgi:membrane-bound ClpP family serine protease
MIDSFFALSGNAWLIIALIFIFIELLDGSMVIFLPTGISGLLIGGILKLQESGVIPTIITGGFWRYVLWAFLALAISVLMRNIFKTKSPDKDINNY